MNVEKFKNKRLFMSRSNKIYLLIVTILGIIARISFILNVHCDPISDFEKYQIIGTNIFLGKGHIYLNKPTAFQPMGYPYTLGYFYKIMGSNNVFLGKILNVLLSTITLIIILLILFKLCHNILTVSLAYTFITFIPNYIAYNNVLGSEILITFFLSIIIYLQLCNFNNIIRYMLLGFFIGLASLTKPFFLIYPLIISLIQWTKIKNFKETLKLFSISFIFMCLVVAPWTYRNYKTFNLFIPVSHNGGYVLFINNNDNNNTGAWMSLNDINISENLETEFQKNNFNYKDKSKDEVNEIMLNPKLDNIFKREAKKWILHNPGDFCKLGIIRLRNTFFHGAGDIYLWAMNSSKITKYSSFIKSVPIMTLFNKSIHVLSFCGFLYVILNLKNIIVSLFSKKITVNYIISIPFFNIAYFILIPFVFEGQQRYNFPILFLCSICLAIFIEKLSKYIRYKNSSTVKI